jgi:hypothetical protein
MLEMLEISLEQGEFTPKIKQMLIHTIAAAKGNAND